MVASLYRTAFTVMRTRAAAWCPPLGALFANCTSLYASTPYSGRSYSTDAGPGAARFVGTTVLVTGGTQGIGRCTALAFAHEGADVFVADILRPDAAQLQADRQLAGSIEYFDCDAGCPDAVQSACAAAGPREVLVNNVAVQPEAPCHEHSLADWHRAINVNLTSVFLFSKYAIPHMLAKGKGAIINVASVQGLQSQPSIPGYAASKGGVLSLTRQLAVEYASQGIRVNAVSPGTIATPLVQNILKLRGTSEEDAGAVYPMKRIGSPEEIAKAITFLASDDASFITAENVVVDGGIMGLGGWATVA